MVSLSPLKLEMLDLNNKPLEYIDVSKIGSHTLYKLKFTNTNNVEIKLGSLLDPPSEYYEVAMAQKLGESIEIYYAKHPGAALGLFVKTSNADDCLNQIQTTKNGVPFTPLVPSQSCSYYAYADNAGQNKTANDTFTEPVSYFIFTDPIFNGRSFSLSVVQCEQTAPYPNYEYNCSNMSKPGFSEQFIKYKILPINGISNLKPFNVYGNNFSNDGKWFWSCTGTVCNKYALNYNGQNNTLTLESTPAQTVNIAISGTNMNRLYPSIDGSSVWVSRYSYPGPGFSLVNTARPDILLWECGHAPCVPNIRTTDSVFISGVIGLDGSFWWDTGDRFNADIYDPIAQTFIQTNIPWVAGVNSDGTVIGFTNGKPGCWDAGDSYTSYKYRGPLLNYVGPDSGTDVTSDTKNVYFNMLVPDIVGKGTVKAYYKVHTENGLCEINPEDYTFFVANTSSYSLGISLLNDYKTFFVTPISNIYSGL